MGVLYHDVIIGDSTQDKDLKNAGVEKADSIIVLTDFSKSANEADAEALMIVLAVESINRRIHTCAQIMNSSNRIHLQRAHADEIVCLDQMGGNLVVASAMNHGVSCVVQELLTFNADSEFYRYDNPLSNNIVGMEFSEVVQTLSKKRIILLGFETNLTPELKQTLNKDELHMLEDKTRALVVNQQGRYNPQQGDALFVISETEPAET